MSDSLRCKVRCDMIIKTVHEHQKLDEESDLNKPPIPGREWHKSFGFEDEDLIKAASGALCGR